MRTDPRSLMNPKLKKHKENQVMAGKSEAISSNPSTARKEKKKVGKREVGKKENHVKLHN
jgi:hypothetical protein